MPERLRKILRDVGSLYDFDAFEAPEIPERSALHYLGAAFDYVGNGLKTSAAEIEEDRAEKAEQLELLGTGKH